MYINYVHLVTFTSKSLVESGIKPNESFSIHSPFNLTFSLKVMQNAVLTIKLLHLKHNVQYCNVSPLFT